MSTWGSGYWFVIHTTAFALPDVMDDDDKTAFRQFIQSLPRLLPCPKCGRHMAENLEKHPPPIDEGSGPALFKWTLAFHNEVNKMLGKPTMPEEDAVQHLMQQLYGVRPVSSMFLENLKTPSTDAWMSLGVTASLALASLMAAKYFN